MIFPGPPQRAGQRDAGFTLIELMISLGLFALIAVAGLALVDSIIGVQSRTGARLDTMADVQRAMYVVASDLDQVARGRIVSDGAGLTFTRVAPGFGGPPVAVRYALVGDVLTRSIGGVPQRLLTGVETARFRVFDGDWRAGWPVSQDEADAWPRAVEMQVALAGRGTLRRVVTLPARPVSGP